MDCASNSENVCVFRHETDCRPQDEYSSSPLTEVRKSSAQAASKKRGDNLHLFLESTGDDLYYHKKCYTTYTSKEHIKRCLKRKSENVGDSAAESSKRSTRASSLFFDFKQNCFICSKICNVVPDKKHPDRWEKNKGFVCRTADRGKGALTFKEVLLNTCTERGDALADEVRIRLEGATSDLHAAEARYHEKCLKMFSNPKVIATAQKDNPVKSPEEFAVRFVIRSMRNEPERTWTSVELHQMYKEQGGTEKNRHRFMNLITTQMKDEIYVFTSPGIASVLMMKEKASSTFKLVSLTDEDEDDDILLKTVAKRIRSELNQIPFDSKHYIILNSDNLFDECSPTLTTLLSMVSPTFSNSLSNAMVGHIVTGQFTGHHTRLQLALAVLIRSKVIIERLYEYGVTTTPKEYRRFKVSGAAAKDKQLPKSNLDSSKGLIQVVTDNFDATVHSQNGMKDTHGLATIVTQSCTSLEVESPPATLIPRLSDEEMKNIIFEEEKVHFYSGPKDPAPPIDFFRYNPLPLKVLCQQIKIVERSKNTDFHFLKTSVTSDGTLPDYHGFNTSLERVSGLSAKPKTEVQFKPLMDRTPADPSSILTAMVEAEQITNEAGQMITVFTADQQLYRIALDITWSDPDRWKFFVPRIGGMHWLMSFVGCVGVLMANSGLHSVLKSAFAGVDKMLLGKKFPMNVRALRFVVLELLRGQINEISSYDELMNWLNDKCTQSILSEHWIKNLIKPVLIMLLYIRAEREGEFALHLYACQEMMPYFFAAGHINYARYGLCYLRSMERIPGNVLDQFMKGQHVMRHQNGLFNSIWSDMIETTYMKFGKGPGGIIGFTTKPKTLQIWAKSQHACTQVVKELSNLSKKEESIKKTHKEESKGRIAADEIDRKKLRGFLSSCIQPLDPTSHDPSVLCNIYTGETGVSESNVNKSVEIGTSQMKTFQQALPEGFRNTISKLVITMKKGKQQNKKEIVELYNTELIFARVTYLLSVNQIKIDDLFNYELSPIPTSLFKDSGDGRYPKNKSDLKNALKVDVSPRNVHPEAVFIDGCAMLHSSIYWPKGGKVEDLLKGIRNYIRKFLCDVDVYLVFDRYKEYSIKSDTRVERLGQIRRTHTLMIGSPLPSKDITLKVTKTKVQLISLIANDLLNHFLESTNKLIITSASECPEQSHEGKRTVRHDMKTSHEEADVIIPQQVSFAIKEGRGSLKVISEDTDVFVLLCHFYFTQHWTIQLFMEGFGVEKTMTCIKSSVERNKDILPSLLSAHAFGCDTVPSMYGVGKKTIIKAIKKQPLLLFGEEGTTEAEYISEAKKLVAACYGGKSESSSENRKIIWKRRTDASKLTSKPVGLKSLPPTDPVLEINIKRARHQRMIWGASLQPDPPTSDPREEGWDEDTETKTLRPVMLPKGCKTAPDEVLKSTRCNCEASHCKTLSCSCSKVKIPCSEFCGCQQYGCCNKWNEGIEASEDENSDSEIDEEDEDEEE